MLAWAVPVATPDRTVAPAPGGTVLVRAAAWAVPAADRTTAETAPMTHRRGVPNMTPPRSRPGTADHRSGPDGIIRVTRNIETGARTTAGERRGTVRLQELRATPLLAAYVLAEEGEHGLVPDPGVAGREDPVVLVREVEELRLHLVPYEIRPQPQGVVVWVVVVVVVVVLVL